MRFHVGKINILVCFSLLPLLGCGLSGDPSSVLRRQSSTARTRVQPTYTPAACAKFPRVYTLPTPGVNEPQLPRVFMNTAMPTQTGATIQVSAGGDLQGALNAAQPGDTIVLQSGAVFSGEFQLPRKANPNGLWIVIRGSDESTLPPECNRIDPYFNAAAMPKILGDGFAAITTAPGAGYFRFVGIEFSVGPNVLADALAGGAEQNGIIRFADPSSSGQPGYGTVANLPHHLVIDRCYVHGLPTKNTRRGITLNSAWSAVIDSWVSEFHTLGPDSQAIAGWAGTGPFKIVNNFLSSASEVIIWGGGDPTINGTYSSDPPANSSDIEMRLNHLYKPMSWRQGDPSYAGIPWNVKNLFETKSASRMLVDGNLFENNWPAAQAGFALLFKSTNQDGGCTWCVSEHFTLTNNIIRNSGNGINLVGVYNNPGITAVKAQHILFRNNLFEGINGARLGDPGAGIFLQLGDIANVHLEHNTAINDGTTVVFSSPTSDDFIMRNNILSHQGYGVKGGGTGTGLPSLTAYATNYSFTSNVLAADQSVSGLYPSGNLFSGDLAGIGFVRLISGGPGGDYRLGSSSPYRNAASDGTAQGADMTAVNATTAQVRSDVGP